MTRIEKINKKLKYWQVFFNLREWDLKLKLVDFNRPDWPQTGDIKVDLEKKSATILISKEETGKDNGIIVHELIHLLLWEYDHYSEESLPKNKKKKYFDLLEEMVKKLEHIFLEKD